MNNALTIHRATLQDLAQLLPLFQSYCSFYGLPERPEAKSFLTERLSKQDTAIFLARISDKPAGFVQLFNSFSIYNLGAYYVLNDLYVASEYRKQGIGEALLLHAQHYCKETNGRGLLLETGHDNLPAQKLYTKLGFKPANVLFMGWEA